MSSCASPQIGAIREGCFVCVVGPSGAGKDTLMTLAREELADDARYLFPQRLVTRPPSAFEDNATLSEPAFAAAVETGRFALSWRAHGFGYGLDRSALDETENGAIVVCNISRGCIVDARSRFRAVRVVLVTAPASVLAERLHRRGREDGSRLDSRLARPGLPEEAGQPDLVIENVASPEIGARQLVEFLRSLA